MFDRDRIVGLESQKSYRDKVDSGFFAKYLSGENILDVGFAGHGGDGQPIVANAIGVDINYPGYDGITLPFADESQDAVYSSHCYEHIADHIGAIRDWYRVLKVGGFIVLVLPHVHLFERRHSLPSRWNLDHKRFFTPGKLITEIEDAFPPNTFRIRHLCDNDKDFPYAAMPHEAVDGCYEIELVLEKLPPLTWMPDNGNARHWGPQEFSARRDDGSGLRREIDLTKDHFEGCWVWGPYAPLSKGQFTVRIQIEASGLEGQRLRQPILVDVARDLGAIVLCTAEINAGNQDEVFARGYFEISFYNPSHGSLHEFRISLPAEPPFDGRLHFYGAQISMTR